MGVGTLAQERGWRAGPRIGSLLVKRERAVLVGSLNATAEFGGKPPCCGSLRRPNRTFSSLGLAKPAPRNSVHNKHSSERFINDQLLVFILTTYSDVKVFLRGYRVRGTNSIYV